MPIAFDAATDGGNNGGSGSRTFAHTCTGTDRLLLVGFKGDVTSGNDDVSGVTYNGVAMTLVAKVTTTVDRFTYLYYLLNPASGANNVVISTTNSHFILAVAASYTGVAQSGQPDNFTTNAAGAASSVTGTLTTVADNCWTMAIGARNFSGFGMTAGAGTTERVEDAAFLTQGMFDSNGAITPAGSTSLVVEPADGTSNMAIVMASFSPAGGGSGGGFIDNTSPILRHILGTAL